MEIRQIIKKRYELLKKESKTYGELRGKIEIEKRNVGWTSPKLIDAIGEEFEEIMLEEIDGLPCR